MVAATFQATLQAAITGTSVTGTTEVSMLASYAPPATDNIRSTRLTALATAVGLGVPASSELFVLVAYRTGTIINLNNRAWEFTLDGHTFYVLTLGEQGTWVYDTTTGSWAQWQTTGMTSWNMELGSTWKGDVIAADQQNPIIWRLDPDSFIDDDFKPQVRKVTGGLAMRNRVFVANYAFRITASPGRVAVPPTAPPTEPVVTLRFSDDQGNTFFDAGSITITPNLFYQPIQWLSLGIMRPPQRIFEITDTGAIARLDGADAEIEGEG